MNDLSGYLPKAVRTLREHGVVIFLPLCLLLFLGLSGYDVRHPGLYYDEVLFVNAALGGKIDLFIYQRLGELPVMVMPYIGALKAWLYYPLFKMFDVTGFSVRWPVLIIGALTLWLNYRLMKEAFSRTAAIIFLLLASVEPSTLFHTRLDWGPTALMMLFRSALLLSLLLWLKTGNGKYLFVAAGACILGVFDKLNFIWVVTAAFCAVALIYPDRLTYFIRLHRKKVITLVGLGFVCAAGLAGYFFRSFHFGQELGVMDWAARWSYFFGMMLPGTVSGTSVYGFICGSPGMMATRQLYILGAVTVVALLILAAKSKNFESWRVLAFWGCFTAVVLVQMFFTRRATGPHHAAMLAPFWLIPASVGLSRAFDKQAPSGILFKTASILSVALLFVSSLSIDVTYLKAFRTHVVNPNWDTASYRLSEVLEKTGNRPVICVDWGLATVMYGLRNGKIEIYDRWPAFMNRLDKSDIEDFESKLLPRNPLFVVRAAGKETFPETRRYFLDTAKARNWKMQILTVVKDMNGLPLNEIYSVTKATDKYPDLFVQRSHHGAETY